MKVKMAVSILVDGSNQEEKQAMSVIAATRSRFSHKIKYEKAQTLDKMQI